MKQIEGTHETARNLISESLASFETLQDTRKIAEAQMELGHCYWREGEFDEARVWLKEALDRVPDDARELKAITLSRLATFERAAKRLDDAHQLLTVAASLVNTGHNNSLKGKFYNQFATVLENVGRAENTKDYIDRALIEYAAASYYFELAGHTRYQGCVENNLGFLFSTIEKFPEAHQHLDRAQALFTSLEDNTRLAGVDETRAKVLLAEGRTSESEKLVRGAAALEKLQSGERFDVLIFDNKLPDATGIELIRHTRRLAHRQQTPVIMFSGEVVEMEARRAGANAFLRKPGDLSLIAETVARLLARKRGREERDSSPLSL